MTDNYSSSDQLTLSAKDAQNLQEGAKWARFISIVSLVMLGLVLTGLVVFGGTMLTMATMQGGAAAAGAVTGVFIIYGVIFFIGLYLTWMQYKFSSRAIDAVKSGDQLALTESLSAQRKMYKVSGIIMAIYLGFAALGLLMAVLGGAAAFFAG